MYAALTKVRREREQLLAHQREQRVDGCIAQVLVVVDFGVTIFFGDTKVATRHRHVYLVALHRGVVAVLPVLRDLPSELWRP